MTDTKSIMSSYRCKGAQHHRILNEMKKRRDIIKSISTPAPLKGTDPSVPEVPAEDAENNVNVPRSDKSPSVLRSERKRRWVKQKMRTNRSILSPQKKMTEEEDTSLDFESVHDSMSGDGTEESEVDKLTDFDSISISGIDTSGTSDTFLFSFSDAKNALRSHPSDESSEDDKDVIEGQDVYNKDLEFYEENCIYDNNIDSDVIVDSGEATDSSGTIGGSSSCDHLGLMISNDSSEAVTNPATDVFRIFGQRTDSEEGFITQVSSPSSLLEVRSGFGNFGSSQANDSPTNREPTIEEGAIENRDDNEEIRHCHAGIDKEETFDNDDSIKETISQFQGVEPNLPDTSHQRSECVQSGEIFSPEQGPFTDSYILTKKDSTPPPPPLAAIHPQEMNVGHRVERFNSMLERVSKNTNRTNNNKKWWDDDSRMQSILSPKIGKHSQSGDVCDFDSTMKQISEFFDEVFCGFAMFGDEVEAQDDRIGNEIDMDRAIHVEDDITMATAFLSQKQKVKKKKHRYSI